MKKNMIQQQNNIVWFKINGLARLFWVHCLSGVLPLYIVNEYPKCGGSWLGQMLSEALEVPFPRNRLPMLCSSIMHGHYIRPGFMKNVIVMWRDGRDVIISQYYQSLFKNDRGNQRLVDDTRKNLKFSNYEDIKNNLLDFIKYVYSRKAYPKFSWSDFYQVWGQRNNVIHVKYEDSRHNAVFELQRIVTALTNKPFDINQANIIADKYSFEQQAGRVPGLEDKSSFLRKGIVGDWKNHLGAALLERP